MSALTTANNGLLVTSATGVPSILAGPGTTGNILQSNAAAAPSFSTTTYPSTNAINTDYVCKCGECITGSITAANNGTLITSATGVPSWLANGTTGQVLTATTGSPPSWSNASGTGTVSSGLINQLAWYAAGGTTVSGLATSASAVLTTVTSVSLPGQVNYH